jgi:hypothetical protein
VKFKSSFPGSIFKHGSAGVAAAQARMFDQLSPTVHFAKQLCERAGFDFEHALAQNDPFALKRYIDDRRLNPAVAIEKRKAELRAAIEHNQNRLVEIKQTFEVFNHQFVRLGLPTITENTSADELRANLKSFMDTAAKEQLAKIGLLHPSDVQPAALPIKPPELTGLERTKALLKACSQRQAG